MRFIYVCIFEPSLTPSYTRFKSKIMKNLLLVLFLGLGFTLNAQLFVKPTASDASYIYVSDTYVYIENDVELETNRTLANTDKGIPNILLRNDAQLLQGNDAALNSGNGQVSVYQEGTVNQFDYNLWASPVGLSETDASRTAPAPGNSDFAFRPQTAGYEDQIFYTPTSVTQSNPAFATGSYNGTSNDNFLNIASYWLWAYKSGTGYADFVHISNVNNLEAGYGFTMKGVSGTDTNDGGESTPNNNGDNTDGEGQRYDFRGRANNGTISGVTVGPTTDPSSPTQTMVGNPYPSALDLNYFLLQNSRDTSVSGSENYSEVVDGQTVSFTRKSVTNGIAYFWDSDPSVNSHYLTDYQGGYGTYSPMGSLNGNGLYTNASYFMYNASGEQTSDTGNDGAFYNRRFTPVAQGFFVTGAETQETDPNATEIVFNNQQRVFVKEGNNSDFRSAQDSNDDIVDAVGVSHTYRDINNMRRLSHIKFNVAINDTYSRELAIGFLENATAGVDASMDAQTIDNIGTDVGFSINDINNFVINAVPRDEYQWIPLSVKAANTAEFKFAVHHTEEFAYSDVYLVDRDTETYQSILNNEVLIVLEAGTYNDRFYIRFTKEQEQQEETNDDQTTDDQSEETTEEETAEDNNTDDQSIEIAVEEQDPFVEESVLESFTIVQNNASGQLEIYNPNNIVVNDVAIFDLTGKQIFNEVNLGSQVEYTFPTRNIATGIYIVQFVTQDGLTKGRKISVVN